MICAIAIGAVLTLGGDPGGANPVPTTNHVPIGFLNVHTNDPVAVNTMFGDTQPYTGGVRTWVTAGSTAATVGNLTFSEPVSTQQTGVTPSNFFFNVLDSVMRHVSNRGH